LIKTSGPFLLCHNLNGPETVIIPARQPAQTLVAADARPVMITTPGPFVLRHNLSGRKP